MLVVMILRKIKLRRERNDVKKKKRGDNVGGSWIVNPIYLAFGLSQSGRIEFSGPNLNPFIFKF